MGSLKPLLEPAAAESIVAKRGTTTTNGAVDGSTVVDVGLTQADNYWNDMTILIVSGACDGQSRDITGFTGGTLTVSPIFASRILSGVRYFILPFKPSAAEVEDMKGTGFVKDTDSLVDLSHEAGAKGTDNISDHLGWEGATALATKLTLLRAGYLDNINNANLATIADISSLTATEIGYLAELAAANIPSDIDGLKLGLDNLTGDMSAVAHSETGSLSAFQKRHVDHARAHIQTRIGLIIPDLSNIGTDAANAAIKTQLDLTGSCNYIDQTGIDGGDNNWLEYNLIVVGSDANYAFNTANLDDLITLKIPIIVVSSAVAIHLKMGHDAVADTGAVTNIYVETISDRVMAVVFGALGDQTIFSAGSVSSRLDMSNAQLTEHLLATVGGGGGGTNTETVVGDLPFSDGAGEIFTLDEGTPLPAGRVFAGCFLHAENLNLLGQEFLRRLCRNITQSITTPSLEIKASATKINSILADTNELQTDWVDGGRLDLLVDGIKAKTDNLSGANAAVSGSLTWVTATHTINEGDISALFSTDLTGATRRRYSIYIDMTGPGADAAAWTKCTVRVKIGFGAADAYRTVDLKEIAKTDVAAAKEPGVPIDVPATAKNVQITLQFDVALGADATIYYSYVSEALE